MKKMMISSTGQKVGVAIVLGGFAWVWPLPIKNPPFTVKTEDLVETPFEVGDIVKPKGIGRSGKIIAVGERQAVIERTRDNPEGQFDNFFFANLELSLG